MLELAALIVVVAYLAWDRIQTARILASTTPDLAELVALTDRLAQRIQAPTMAVVEHNQAVMPEHAPPAVPMTDDNAFWESKEQMAERLDAAAKQLDHELRIARAG